MKIDFDNISENTLLQASRAALKKSCDFHHEAQLLHKLRSYGHSISIAVLGIEEFGKSIEYGLLINLLHLTISLQENCNT